MNSNIHVFRYIVWSHSKISKSLTGHSNMAVRFSLVDHIHNLIRAGDETLSASLRENRERIPFNTKDLMQPKDRLSPKRATYKGYEKDSSTYKLSQTLTYGTLFLSSWTDRLVFVTEKYRQMMSERALWATVKLWKRGRCSEEMGWKFLGTDHPAGHEFCPCRFQSRKPVGEEGKWRNQDKMRFACFIAIKNIVKRDAGQMINFTVRNKTALQIQAHLKKDMNSWNTLMWNSRFSSIAKMWLNMSSAMRGIIPIWWGSWSLPCSRKSQIKV